MRHIKQPPLYIIFIGFLIGIAILYLIAQLVNPSFFIKVVILIAIVLFIGTFSTLLNIFGPRRFFYDLQDWDDKTCWYHPKYDSNNWNIVLDTHVHTLYSDGRLTVEQVIKYHLAVGFNAAVFTDHNNMNNLKEVLEKKELYKNVFLVIPGMEWTTNRIHLCLIGIIDWDCTNIPKRPTNEEIKKVIDDVHQRGGVVSVNHYPWSTGGENPRIKDHPTREEMYAMGVDLIEVANWDDDISLVDMESYHFAKDPAHPTIAPCTGTDMHDPIKDPLCGWTLLKTKEFSEQAVMTELKAHRTDVVLESFGIPYPIKHSESKPYHILQPFYMIGDFFKGFYQGGRVSNLNVKAIMVFELYLFLGFLLLILFSPFFC